MELAGLPGDQLPPAEIENVQSVAPKVRRSSHHKDTSPVKHSAIKYGELVILG